MPTTLPARRAPPHARGRRIWALVLLLALASSAAIAVMAGHPAPALQEVAGP